MILSDRDINRRCSDDKDTSLIWPYKREDVQPASVDLTLDSLFLKPAEPNRWRYIDLENVQVEYTEVETTRYVLAPNEFLLGSTAEWINVPPTLVGSIEGKSSLARLGLAIHMTAGFLDPGFRGKVTLELLNVNTRAIVLRPGLRICQVAFHELSSMPERPYGSPGLNSKYQNQDQTTASKYAG